MAFTLSIETGLPYLMVTAVGRASLGELNGLATLIGEVAGHRGLRRVLADLARVEPDLSFTEHLQVGAHASGVLRRLEKLATVVPPAYLDAPSARAAQLAGLTVRTFLDLAEATAWLQEPSPANA